MLTRPVKTPSQAGHPWQTDFLHCQAAPDMYKVSSAFSGFRRRWLIAEQKSGPASKNSHDVAGLCAGSRACVLQSGSNTSKRIRLRRQGRPSLTSIFGGRARTTGQEAFAARGLYLVSITSRSSATKAALLSCVAGRIGIRNLTAALGRLAT